MMRCPLDESTDEPVSRHVEDAVASYLNDILAGDEHLQANLDRWSRKQVAADNLDKVRLVMSAECPLDRCRANLVREIDAEAESGIYLATPAGSVAQLQRLAGRSGMSGRLFQHMASIAPIVFANDMQHFAGGVDLLWAVLEARYTRARIRVEVSELTLMHLLDADDQAVDLTDDIRNTLYTFHEDRVRRRCDLARILSRRASQDWAEKAARLLAAATL